MIELLGIALSGRYLRPVLTESSKNRSFLFYNEWLKYFLRNNDSATNTYLKVINDLSKGMKQHVTI